MVRMTGRWSSFASAFTAANSSRNNTPTAMAVRANRVRRPLPVITGADELRPARLAEYPGQFAERLVEHAPRLLPLRVGESVHRANRGRVVFGADVGERGRQHLPRRLHLLHRGSL